MATGTAKSVSDIKPAGNLLPKEAEIMIGTENFKIKELPFKKFKKLNTIIADSITEFSQIWGGGGNDVRNAISGSEDENTQDRAGKVIAKLINIIQLKLTDILVLSLEGTPGFAPEMVEDKMTSTQASYIATVIWEQNYEQAAGNLNSLFEKMRSRFR